MAFKGIDVKYNRNDLHSVGTTNGGCLVVYPQTKKARQRVGVGDASGSAVVFSVGKHHELKEEFKTPPMAKPISRMTLYQDQLFTMNGATLNAYTRKGKNFFGFDSNLTETVKSLAIETPYIYGGGEYVLTTFQESKELGFYMAPDKINEMLAMPSTGEPNTACDAYLGCQDRYIRVIRDNKQIAEGSCESALTALTFAKDPSNAKRREIIYGTAAGSIGAYSLTVGGGGDVTRKYAAVPASRAAAVTCVATCDVNADGMPHIVVGRDDGSVEFHAVGASGGGNMLEGDEASHPAPIWRANVSETVTGIAVGAVTGSELDEIVLSTYSGKVISFSQSEAGVSVIVPSAMTAKVDVTTAKAAVVARPSDTAEADRAASQEVLAAKVKEVQKEMEAMKSQLEARQKEYATLVHGLNAGPNKQSVAVASEFHVRAKWALEGSACLGLVLEVDAPIDTVCLRSDVALELFDEVDREAANIVVSMGSPQLQTGASTLSTSNSSGGGGAEPNLNAEGGSKMLCVVRPSDSSATRIEVQFRPLEGTPGEISAFITPKLTPRTAQLKTFPVHALCLHQRIAGDEVAWETLPMSVLKMTGPFTARDVHGWLFSLLPDVPETLTTDAGALYFKNTFVGSFLFARYGKGEAEFKSENITTLAIIRETLTREATQRKIAVKLASEPSADSTTHTLRLLHPLVGQQLRLVQQLKVLDALKEIEGNEDDRSFLSEEHKAVLASANAIQRDVRLQPKRTEYLKSLIVRLFKDRSSFRGEVTPVSRLKELDHLLDNYDEAQLEAFFK